jgi:hypothetical protein
MGRGKRGKFGQTKTILMNKERFSLETSVVMRLVTFEKPADKLPGCMVLRVP